MGPMQSVHIPIEVLPAARGLELPAFQTAGSAGADVRAAVDGSLTLEPGKMAKVPTGLKVSIPRGYEIQVRPRSGLAARHAITLVNAPGTIDSDYRGEICVLLINLGREPFVVNRGDRIAQLVLSRVDRIEWLVVDSVDETTRGQGGFGHTGV